MATPRLIDTSERPPKLNAETLTLWREQMGYTMNEAADELGCSKRSLTNWENGHFPIPRYIGLAMNALALNMRPYGSKRKRGAD